VSAGCWRQRPRRHCLRRPGPARQFAPTLEAAIEIKQLRYFVRIVDLGSLSRAAGALHIAQSALSQHVAALETTMKTPLLVRTSRGVQPTEAGRLLYQHAQLILQHAADAVTAVQTVSAEPTGHVAFGLPLTLVPLLGLPMFEAVRRAYPGIRLQILEELSGTILEWVKNGRLTLGIAFDDGNLEGLQTIPFMEERLFLIASPRSPFARRKVVPLKEVAALDLVLSTWGQGVRARIDQTMTESKLGRARIAAEIDSLTIMKKAAAAEIGPTILSWASVEAEVLRGELVAVEIVRPAITRVAHVCVLAGTTPSRAADCVRQQVLVAVREALRRPSWRGVRYLGPG
jgi:LysR family nitrogen assimilation transcriptional regulator